MKKVKTNKELLQSGNKILKKHGVNKPKESKKAFEEVLKTAVGK
jgi:hypothetical protein